MSLRFSDFCSFDFKAHGQFPEKEKTKHELVTKKKFVKNVEIQEELPKTLCKQGQITSPSTADNHQDGTRVLI